MIVIYHANCTDGFTAAWCAWLLYGYSAEYVPARYGDEAPPDVTDRDVLILDFSYSRLLLLEMSAAARSLRVLDHHRTAQADLEGLDFCTFDMARSGAGLAWDELHGGKRPLLVDYVEDRDLWAWQLYGSREVSAYLGTYEHDFELWQRLSEELERDLEGVIRSGRTARRLVDQYVARRRGEASRVRLGAHEVPGINTTFAHSELIGALAQDEPFALGWFARSDGQIVYSLRSGDGGLDVSEIARQYGGGGHRAAAGFTVPAFVHEVIG